MNALVDLAQGQPILYHGFYLGLVEDTADPEVLGRVRIRVGHIHPVDQALVPTTSLPWAPIIQSFGGLPNQGQYHVPAVGSQVVVMFNQGHPDHPLCLGTVYARGDTPREVAGRVAGPAGNNSLGTSPFPGSNPSGSAATAPLVHEVKTPGGHKVVLDDNPDTPDVIVESGGGHVITLDDHSTRPRIEMQTKGGHNVTLWDGSSSTPARIEVTSILGHKIVINDDSADQSISMTSKLGHTFQMNDVGKGQFMTMRTAGGCEAKFNDKGSGGAPQVTVNTRKGMRLDMLDSTDTLYLSTLGGSALIAVGSGYVSMATATGYRVDVGGVNNKVSITSPAGGAMDILCGTKLQIQSTASMEIATDGIMTFRAKSVNWILG